MRKSIIAGLCLVISFPMFAAEKKSNVWQGGVELGWLATSGNTDTESLNLKATLEYKQEAWRHKLSVSALRASDSGTTTADQRDIGFRSRYDLSQYDYLFGNLRYEKDPFAGFDRRTTEIVGYGRDVIKRDDMVLDMEGGVGGRQTNQTDGVDKSEGIVRLAADYKWDFTKTSEFSQELSVEHGKENTVSQSVTALKLKINSRLAMKTSYSVTHNSDVPVGTEKRDTRTAVTLVYDF
jgi:putative salt-induced outer membrane protein